MSESSSIPSRYRRKNKPKLQIQTHQSPSLSPPLSPKSTDDNSDDPGLSATSAQSNWSLTSLPTPTPTPNPIIKLPVAIQLPTQTVYKFIPHTTTVAELLQDLISEHRYELGQDVEDLMLWETVANNNITIKRPLRSTEYFKHIARSWGIEGSEYGAIMNNCIKISVTGSSFRLDQSSLASLTPRRDIIKDCPKFSTSLYWCTGGINSKKTSWKRCNIQIRNGSLLNISTSSVDRNLTIDEYDCYEGFPLAKESSSTYIVSMRSQQSPLYFDTPSDTEHHFTTNNKDDYNLLRNIIFSLRNQAVEKLSRKFANNLEERKMNYQQQSLLISACHSPPSSSTSTFSSSPILGRGAGRIVSNGNNQSPFIADGLLGKEYTNVKDQMVKKGLPGTSIKSHDYQNRPPLRAKPIVNGGIVNQKGIGLLHNIPLNGKQSTYQRQQTNQQLPSHSMALLHRAK